MAVAWLVFILYSCWAFLNLKKAILAWMPIRLLFLNRQIALYYGSPVIYLYMAIDVLLFLSFMLKYRQLYNERQIVLEKFPWSSVIILLASSFFFSQLFSTISLSSVFFEIVRFFLSNFLFLFLFFIFLKTNQDIKYVLLCSCVVGILLFSLSFYEIIFKHNPWLDYVWYNSPHEHMRMYYNALAGHSWYRFGFIRAQSFFCISIFFGVVSTILCFMFILFQEYEKIKKNKRIYIFVALLLFVCVIFSNSKTPILGALMIIFYAIFQNRECTNKRIFIVCLLLFVIYSFMPNAFYNIGSVFNDDLAEESSGSTVEMRSRQFVIGFDMFKLNPLFGNGFGSISVLKKIGDNSDILGAESVWLKILPERGLYGAFVYVYSYIYIYIRFKKYIPSFFMFLYLIALVFMETATDYIDLSVSGSVLVVFFRFFKLRSA